MLRVGDRAPDFRAPSSKGQTLEAESFLGKVPVVLTFVPDPDSADGQVVLAELDEHLVEFGHERVQVLGVVPRSPRAARELADDRQLSLAVLADEAGSISGAFLGDAEATDEVVAVMIDCDGSIAGTYRSDEATGFVPGLRGRVEELLDPTA